MTTESRADAYLFSVQRALPEELPATLTALAIDSDEQTLYLRCFFQGEADREFIRYMQDAVWSDYFPTINLEVEALKADLAEVLPVGTWVFRQQARELVRS